MNSQIKLDAVDKQILQYLVKNTRMPFTEIAKKMDVSAGTIHVRMKKLEENGMVTGSSLTVNYEKLGYNFIAYVGILLVKSNKTKMVMSKLYNIPNVTVCNIISGKYNILCKIRAKDTHDAKEVIFAIDEIDEVLRTESFISLEETFNDKNRLLDIILN